MKFATNYPQNDNLEVILCVIIYGISSELTSEFFQMDIKFRTEFHT